MAGTVYATWQDVQDGFEKPIPPSVQPKVDEFLERASRRLRILRKQLQPALDQAGPDSDLSGFVKDMVVDAAERKLRNPGGFSHENAGVFSVSRYEDFSKGRIDFNPEDLALLDQHIDDTFGAVVRGPIRSHITGWRFP